MKKTFLPLLVGIAVLAACCLQGCSAARDREALSSAHVYDRPYDKVWEALEDLLYNELACVAKKADKKGGVIETEWVHVFDTEGTKRWMIRAEIRKVPAGVQVLIDKRIEMADKVSRAIHNYKKETKEPQAPGWKKTAADRSAFEALYRSLAQKLEQ